MLLQKGIMCRGYITRGQIYHDEGNFVGTGYQKALDAERGVSVFKREADERGTPFVEIDRVVCDYVKNSGDACVKEMFSRFVRSDGDGVALFPFQRLCHSFVISADRTFDPEKEHRSNDNLRRMILSLKGRLMTFVSPNNAQALKKAEHYIAALDAQLAMCDRTDEAIALFESR